MKNVSAIFDVINDKLEELSTICIANSIPFAFLCAAETETGTETKERFVTPQSLNVTLSNDKITPLLAYACTDKFKLVMIKEADVYTAEDFAPSDIGDEE